MMRKTKHYDDNIKPNSQTKVGMLRNYRENNEQLVRENVIADANTTIGLDTMSIDFESATKERYPTFAKYYETSLQQRLRKHVPTRKLK